MGSSRTPPDSCGITFRSPLQVKRGCLSCRTRKVKCDGTRPCRQCTAMGKVCDAYADRGESCPSGRRTPRPSPPTPSVSMARCNTHAGLAGLSASDRRRFEWFVHQASSRLPGIFSAPYWKNLVLQASSTEPAILYAILALGAVDEQELAITEPCDVRDDEANDPQSPKAARHLGLQYYNKSISLLQPHLLKSGTGPTRVALIACTIFVCLEFMQRRYKPGFLHFGYSLQLLGSLLRNRSSATSTDLSDDWFAEEIPRLDLQAALLMNEFYLGAADATSFTWHPLPHAFQTTRDASHSLDGLLFRAHQLQKNGSAINLSEDAVNIFELLATQQALRKDLEEWLHYFEVFKANSLSHLSNGERLTCQRLPIYHTMAHIITNTSLNPRNELIFDLYTHQFTSVVFHSRQIINTVQLSELPTPAADTPGSHVPQLDCPADIGLIPPLFYTAIKCRVPRIRRQAVELILLGQRHEGIWDADLTARVAREVMTLEERDVQDSPQDGKCDSPDTSSTTSTISSTPSIPSPPRVHRIWIEVPGYLKGDIQLSVQRIQNGETRETLTRRYNPVNGSWTSCPVPPRVSGAIKHESGK
ncbi:hypothetical protein LY76DRAFT_581604 [Colletotrichum caudatum]|nr:hypothetical protein LY76DRAFT_581604 [Colletotrichum caudatum]